jgi:hypothetical protein
MRTFPHLLSCLALLILTGCAIPVGRELTAGYKYSGDALEFLDLPGTTRNETVASLGPANWESTEARVLLYRWETSLKWHADPVKFEDRYKNRVIIEADDYYTNEANWGLFIAYDDKGLITQHAIRRFGKGDLENVCLNWVRDGKLTLTFGSAISGKLKRNPLYRPFQIVLTAGTNAATIPSNKDLSQDKFSIGMESSQGRKIAELIATEQPWAWEGPQPGPSANGLIFSGNFQKHTWKHVSNQPDPGFESFVARLRGILTADGMTPLARE